MIEAVSLAPGYRISRIIRGGWQLHAAEDVDVATEADRIDGFIEAGIDTFETSDTYAHVDEVLALAIARRRSRGLPLPHVHTRVTLPQADLAASVASTASRLGLPCLDLVQLQSWGLDEPAMAEAGLRLGELSGEVRLRHIGLMNIGDETLARLLRRGVRPLTVQVQLSLLDRRPLAGLSAFARQEGIALLAYGALAGGFLDERWLGRPDPGPSPGPGQSFHAEYRAIIEAFGGWPLFQELLAAVVTVAGRHGVTIAVIALRWVLDQPGVAAALVGARDMARARQWGDAFAIRLTPQDHALLDAVLVRAKGPAGPVGGLERDPASPMARAIAASRAASRP